LQPGQEQLAPPLAKLMEPCRALPCHVTPDHAMQCQITCVVSRHAQHLCVCVHIYMLRAVVPGDLAPSARCLQIAHQCVYFTSCHMESQAYVHVYMHRCMLVLCACMSSEAILLHRLVACPLAARELAHQYVLWFVYHVMPYGITHEYMHPCALVLVA
jgi:hypothetical protein